MNYNWKDLFNIIEKEQIPDIHLYMDQLTTFMEEKLSGYKRNPSDKIITKTMINNYTKDKIMPAPLKKKYSPEQLMLLIIIFHLKPVLSINDIGIMLNCVQAEDIDTRDIFAVFTEIQKSQEIAAENSAEETTAIIKKLMEENNLQGGDNTEVLMTALSLAIDATNKKNMAERLIDDYLKAAKITF